MASTNLSRMCLEGGCSGDHGPSCSGSGFVARSWVRAALLCAVAGFSFSVLPSSTPYASADVLPVATSSVSTPDAQLSPMQTSPLLSESPTGTVLQADPSVFGSIPPEAVEPRAGLLEPDPVAPADEGPVLPVWWDHPEVVKYRFELLCGLGLISLLLGVRVVGGFAR